MDKSNLKSKVSNIVQVGLFIPQTYPSPGESHLNSRISISTLMLSVVGSIVIVSVFLSAIIRILKKKEMQLDQGLDFNKQIER